jgi:ubiquinol-cytochrome c reductase iron-sulfur subunit
VSANGKSSGDDQRHRLKRLSRYFSWVIVAAVAYVLLDFAIDVRPPAVQSSYRFRIDALEFDQARILRQDNLSILILRRSDETINTLERTAESLQDGASRYSHQPDYARNPLRSRHPQYFVSYATGTDLGCALEAVDSGLREICGSARYDFAGRALEGVNKFPNLIIPDYTFTNNFSILTVKP